MWRVGSLVNWILVLALLLSSMSKSSRTETNSPLLDPSGYSSPGYRSQGRVVRRNHRMPLYNARLGVPSIPCPNSVLLPPWESIFVITDPCDGTTVDGPQK